MSTHNAPQADPAELDALRADLMAARYTVPAVEELLGPLASAALHREQPLPALRATARAALQPVASALGGAPRPRNADAPNPPPVASALGGAPRPRNADAPNPPPVASALGGAPRPRNADASGTDARKEGASGEGAEETSAGRLAALVRLFVLGAEVPRRAVDAVFGRLGGDGAVRLGLVEAAGAGPDDAIRALVDLRPYEAADAAGTVDWWLASDLGELATGRALRTDHVLGVGGASTTLAQVTVRDPRQRVLDLGTGCGIQALHASRHARAVIGTDISARALAFARFNASLAGIGPDRIAFREGSMLEPVAGERFDLVVSNPPFVITPRVPGVPEYEYRDGGRAGDAIVRELVTGVGAVLAPGGVAQLLGNWEVRAGEAWDERVGSWLDDAGLDGWVIQRELQDPAEYAETWIRDGGATPDRDRAAWDRLYGAWLDDFASRDVAAVGFGIITLRKPQSGPATLRRLEEQTGTLHQPLGAHLAAGLAAHDWLEGRDDAALGASRLTVAADVTQERYFAPGSPDPTVILLRQGGGLGRAVRAGTALAGFVGACDGELTVGQLVGALAALLELGADDVAAQVLPAARGLVRDGMLLPAARG